MKKTYIQPSLKAIELQMKQGLLAGSGEQLLSEPQPGSGALGREDEGYEW